MRSAGWQLLSKRKASHKNSLLHHSQREHQKTFLWGFRESLQQCHCWILHSEFQDYLDYDFNRQNSSNSLKQYTLLRILCQLRCWVQESILKCMGSQMFPTPKARTVVFSEEATLDHQERPAGRVLPPNTWSSAQNLHLQAGHKGPRGPTHTLLCVPLSYKTALLKGVVL